MDAASRAELSDLRRRAYGRGAGIEDDARALRRLIELEDAVVRERGAAAPAPSAPSPAPSAPASAPAAPAPSPSASAPPPAPPATAPAAPAPAPPAPAEAAPPPPSEARPRARRRTILIAAAAAAIVAVALGSIGLVRLLDSSDTPPVASSTLAPAVRDARAAYSFAWDTQATTLLNIPLDGSFGTYIDLPADGPIPEFPSTGTVQWVAILGRYFGWEVWIAGAAVEPTGLQREHCILIRRDDIERSRCVPAAVRAQSALIVSVPYASVSADERPVGMTTDQRLGFWWRHDRSVTVVVGADP